MRIGIDLDGVTYDFVGALRLYAISIGFDAEQLPANKTWEFWNEWGMTYEEWADIFAHGVDARCVFRIGPPMPGAVRVLNTLRSAGHTIHIVTHRNVGHLSEANTAAWLRDYGVPYDTLTFSKDKAAVPTDIFIDDYVGNLEALRSAGVRAVAFTQAYNAAWDGERVETWGHFEALVLGAQPKIVALSGYAQVGKDTLAAGLIEADGYERLAFADPLREMLYALNPLVGKGDLRVQDIVDFKGWDQAKALPEIRSLLQRLGTDAGRKVLGDDVWVRTTMAKVQQGHAYIITDTRFPNEADAVRDKGGQVVRVQRPEHGPINGHESEVALDGYSFDIGIFNCTTPENAVSALRRALGHE